MTTRPIAQHAATSTTELAQQYLEAAWNRGDATALDALATADLEVSFPLLPDVVRGLDSFRQVLQGMRAGLPDLRFDFHPVATQGDTAVVRWEAAGTHTGPLLGLPATGRAVRWSGLSVVEVANGRVAREWGEEDAMGLFRQLGVGSR
jgi:steroid delta-isomerase-like uncharacterized protein